MNPGPGALLVATPVLQDPNFARSVVLLCAAGEGGAVGVVLNRPMDTPAVTDQLPAWESRLARPRALFRGGPVSTDAAIALGLAGAAGPPERWTPVMETVGLVGSGEPPGEDQLPLARIFAGHAGWAAGQLENEIEYGAWFVVPALAEDVFTSEPEQLWTAVLRRQRGKVAMFAHFPLDPRAN